MIIRPNQFFHLLSDETRLRSLLLLQQEGELCVCELICALNISQPKISRHLAMLRDAMLVLDQRQGQWVFYRINPSLPCWVKSVLMQTADAHVTFLKENLDNLSRMGNRPERTHIHC